MTTSTTPRAPALVGLGPGPTTGLRIVLQSAHLVVGRTPDCAIRLSDRQVGQRHAILRIRDGQVWVQDLRTHGGTFVNGQLLDSPYPLRHGDVVVFGTVALRYEHGTDLPTSAAGPRPGIADDDARHRAEQLVSAAESQTMGWSVIGIGSVLGVVGLGLLAAGALGLVWVALAGLAGVLLVVGFVLLVVAHARLRRLDSDVPSSASVPRR